MKYIFSTV